MNRVFLDQLPHSNNSEGKLVWVDGFQSKIVPMHEHLKSALLSQIDVMKGSESKKKLFKEITENKSNFSSQLTISRDLPYFIHMKGLKGVVTGVHNDYLISGGKPKFKGIEVLYTEEGVQDLIQYELKRTYPKVSPTVYDNSVNWALAYWGINRGELGPTSLKGNYANEKEVINYINQKFINKENGYIIVNLNAGEFSKFNAYKDEYDVHLKNIIAKVKESNPGVNILVTEPDSRLSEVVRKKTMNLISKDKSVAVMPINMIDYWGKFIEGSQRVLSVDSGFVHVANYYLEANKVFTFGAKQSYARELSAREPQYIGPNFWRLPENPHLLADSWEEIYSEIGKFVNTNLGDEIASHFIRCFKKK